MTLSVISPPSIDALRKAHSITSSAMASMPDGMVRPSDLAVLRLMTNSNLSEEHRKLGWLLALKDATDINTSLSIGVRKIDAVADQAAGCGILAKLVYHRHGMLRGERYSWSRRASKNGSAVTDSAKR